MRSLLPVLALLTGCPKNTGPSAPASDATRRVEVVDGLPALCVREGEPRSEALVDLVRSGRTEEAQQQVDALLEAEPEDGCLLASGSVIDLLLVADKSASVGARARAKVRAPQRAQAAWDAAPEDPDNALLVAALIGESDPDGALQALQQAFEVHPAHPEIGWALGSVLAKRERLEEAAAPLLAAYRAGKEGIAPTLTQALYASGQRGDYLRLAAETGQPLGPAREAVLTAEDPWAAYLQAMGLSEGAVLDATLVTSMGEVHCELLYEHAPVTVANFVGLSEGTQPWTNPSTGMSGTGPLYSGTQFHRVIPDFMVQGGDPLGTGTGDPGYRFADEISGEQRFDAPMILAMANSGPGTNGSQFFVTEVATPHLDGRHTIFGRCSQDDLPTVQAMARVPTGRSNDPLQPVTLQEVRIERTNP